jgi:hypothetical protein
MNISKKSYYCTQTASIQYSESYHMHLVNKQRHVKDDSLLHECDISHIKTRAVNCMPNTNDQAKPHNKLVLKRLNKFYAQHKC